MNCLRLFEVIKGGLVYTSTDRTVLSVGRVMTCVLGMVVRREREIRNFVKTPFYRVIGSFESKGMTFDGEWRSVPGSKYFETPYPVSYTHLVEKVINILYKKTQLEDTFGVNMLAIAGGRTETLNFKGILRNYLEFQYQNTTRKYRALLEKELEKKEIREGLIKACDVIRCV